LWKTLPDVKAARARASAAVAKLPPKFRSLEDAGLYPVERSKDLEALVERTRRNTDMKAVFFDIDTQIDFLFPAGSLYVPGGEQLLPALSRLNHYAAAHGIPVVSSMCAHAEDDPEFPPVVCALRHRNNRAT
jgi:hypothetical protein